MAENPGPWTMFHFSQSNGAGPGQGDVPALLRRVADTIEAIEGVQVFDIVFHNEIEDGEDRPHMTVYYSIEPPLERRLRRARGRYP